MKTVFSFLLVLLTTTSAVFANQSTTAAPLEPAGICAACNKPGGLTASNQNGASALLSWTAVSGANSYNIEVEDGSGNPNSFSVVANSASTTYLVSGLLPNLNYKFKVRSKCAGGKKSSWADWQSFNSSGNSNGCAVPVGMATSNLTAHSATLTWTAVPGVSAYRVNVQNASGNNLPMNLTVTVSSNTYTVPGLNPSSNYKWKVRSVCGSQNSPWSALTFFTMPANLGGSSPAPGLSGNGQGGQPIQALVAFPNPTDGPLTVAAEGLQDGAYFVVTNLLGKAVLAGNCEADTDLQLDLSGLPSGLYTLSVLQGGLAYSKKIMRN